MIKGWHPVNDVGQGLALEADLFTDPGQHVVLWQSETSALVCPRAYRKREGFDLAVQRSAERGWPVFQRPSGGGTVPLGPGFLNLALALTVPQSFGITNGYKMLCDPMIRYAQSIGIDLEPGTTPDSFCDGDWNLSFQGRKIVGTAQRLRPLRKGRVRFLGHALILVSGSVVPGAEAVDAFHRDLGLPEVKADVHMTLQDAIGHALPGIDEIAKALRDEARMSIANALQITV